MRLQNSPLLFALLATTSLAPLGPVLAGELPAGGSVAYGSVGISTPGANTMTIQQSSAAAIVNWQSFSVGAGASVNIQQPSASSALLNRVTGATTSTIAGQVSANGQVYLVNPNGIVITPTGTVTAGGGFVASTLGIADEDFKAGRRNFAGSGSSAAVVNQGTIEVGRGGYAALIGGSVENAGTISVPMGKVGLGAGERATLDISGDGFLQVAVPSGSAGEKALIQHSGRIRANGGRVEMQAATAREVARQAINLTGVVEAHTVGGRSGAIVLGGGAGGSVRVSGRLDVSATRQARRADAARARAASGKGGAITVTGDRIQLSGATLDASGRKGGGTIRIGGDLQGKGDLPHARETVVDGKTQILADATETGNGGSVVLWSDAFTGFGGLIRARGGANGGDGGFAEVSSKGVLGYTGRTILTAARGAFGTLLLDPYNIIISDGATTTSPGPAFTPTADDSVINAGDLQTALATANVTISTGDLTSGGSQAGNITIVPSAPLTWSAATTLTLDAYGNIAIGQAISAPAGGLTLQANGSITATAAVNVGTFDLQGGAWAQSGTLPAFSATDFRLSGGSFLRVLGGDGSSTPYQITDVYGLQGIASLGLTGLYVLANDIDASGTSGWNAGAGFAPIGPGTPGFSGSFDGQGHTISGLFINRPSGSGAGLFGSVGADGSVTRLALANADVRSTGNVGTIAGTNYGTISQTRSSGTAEGTYYGSEVGGLVGRNEGSISQSFSTAAVNTPPVSSAGGLVGWNSGSLSQTYALGSVAGSGEYVGGLAGYNAGSVNESYAAAPVSVVGGSFIGGFIGSNIGTVASSFWDTTVSGQAQGFGTNTSSLPVTLTGLTTAQFQNMGSFVPLARPQGWNFDTTWAPPSSGFYPELYAMAPVIRVVTGDVTRPYGDPNGFLTPTYIGGTAAYVFSPAGDTVQLGDTLFSPATPTSPVGTYPIFGMNVTSTLGVTYRLVVTQTDVALAPPSLTVTPAPLTLTATDQTKTYGSTFLFAGTEFSAAGLKNGETIGSAALSSPDGAPATAGVAAGPYAILIGGATGGTFDPSNYSIAYAPGTLTVTPAPLTLTAADQTKTYGSTFLFTGTEFSATGLQNGETIGSAALSSPDGAPATAGVAAGPYAILIGGATGGTFDPANYSIAYAPGILTVTPAPLTLTAADQTKTYGSTFLFAGTEFSAAGLQNGETIGSATLYSPDGAPPTASVAAGPYAILIGGATGGTFDPANYSIGYLPGILMVTPAPLTLTADDQTKAFGSTFLFAGTEFSAAGLQNGETVGSATLASDGAPATADSGSYPILIGNAAGGTFDPGNYAISFVPGTMTVGAHPPPPPPANPTVVLPDENPFALLPTTTVALPNPTDSFDLSGGGPSLGTGAREEAARSSLSAVERSANQLEARVASCDGQLGTKAYKSCVANALAQFANALDARAVRLPGPLRGISAAIRQAARQVRAARTVQEARAAVGAAVAEVRKAIALIRADDPAIGRLQIQQANRIASALGAVESRLSRATGL